MRITNLGYYKHNPMTVHLDMIKETEHFVKATDDGKVRLYQHSIERHNVMQTIFKRQEKEIRVLKMTILKHQAKL